MTRARIAAIACLVVGAALLGMALFGHGWGTVSDNGRVGLRDTICLGARRFYDCVAGVHGSTPATQTEHEQFARFGEIAFVLGALAALAGLGAAVHPRVARALAMPAVVLAAGAVGCATAFVVLTPFYAHSGGAWRTGGAWWIFAAGAAAIAIGAQLGAAGTDAMPRAWVPLAALAIAAVALALTARGAAWWRGGSGDETDAVGTAMVAQCDEDGCKDVRLSDLPGVRLERFLPAPQANLMEAVAGGVVPDRNPARAMIVAGILIDVAAAVAAVLALALAAATLAGRRARWLAWTMLGALGALAAAIVAFESYRPGAAIAPFVDVGRSWGLPLAIAGVVGAVVPSLQVLRRRAPAIAPAPAIATATAAPPTTPDAIPSCTTCRVPMLWVARREIWLCTRCKARGSVPA